MCPGHQSTVQSSLRRPQVPVPRQPHRGPQHLGLGPAPGQRARLQGQGQPGGGGLPRQPQLHQHSQVQPSSLGLPGEPSVPLQPGLLG